MRKAISGSAHVDDKFLRSFPHQGNTPETLDLAIANLSAMQYRKMNSEPQRPEAVAACCSQIDISRAQGVRKLGWLFKMSVRGARLSPEGIASLSYPFAHLGKPTPPFMEVVVHSCTEGGICRSSIMDMMESQEGNVVQIGNRDLDIMQNLGQPISGLRRIEMPAYNDVPAPDREHAESRIRKIMHGSPLIKGLISHGDLIAGEAHYDTHTGKVRWLAFWASGDSANSVPKGVFNAIVEGKLVSESDLEGFHPGLKSLNALVLGNNMFTQQFELPMPTEVVVFGCADSRLSSLIMKTPHGLVEWIHNAGNVIDSRTLRGLRVATEAAVRNVEKDYTDNGPRRGDPEGFKRRAVLMVLSHSRCGAVGATLQHMCGSAHAHHSDEPDPAAPIVKSLSHRFERYVGGGAKDAEESKLLIQAAEANAVGACLDIMRAPGEDSAIIRKLVDENRLVLIPAWYLLTTGVVQMLSPLPSGAALGDYEYRVAAGNE